jgi:hypothetical protein
MPPPRPQLECGAPYDEYMPEASRRTFAEAGQNAQHPTPEP